MTRAMFALILFAAALPAQETGGEKNMTLEWANFAILVIVLGYLIAKTLPQFFRSRTAEIQSGIAEAQQIKQDAERRAKEMEAKLAVLGAEIEKFRTQAHAEMEQEGARIGQETGRQMEKLARQAELEVETAGKVARRELQAYAAKLALDLAEQRVKARLNPETQNGLIQDFVSDLGASQN
jgi:F-type H+-transporting ATPase subunit b